MLLKDDLKIGYGQVMWTKLHFPYQQKLTLITGTENGVQSRLSPPAASIKRRKNRRDLTPELRSDPLLS